MTDDIQELLLDAIEDHDLGLMEKLFEDGATANTSARAFPNWFPIHAATEELNEGAPIELIGRLLEKGVDIDVLDDTGNSALLLAAQNEDWEAVELFLKNGADPSITNIDKYNALQCAVESENLQIVIAMLSTGKCQPILDWWVGFSGRTMLGILAESLNFELIEALVGAGADIYAKDEHDRIAVQYLPDEDEARPKAWLLTRNLLSEGRH